MKRMNTFLSRLCAAAAILVISACSSTLSSVDGNGGNVYALPVTVVDQMLRDAMVSEVPVETLRRGSQPYPMYLGEVTWGSLDTDTISALARPAIGRKLDGSEVEGYVFEVSRKGTAPATGEPTIKRILAKLHKDAELTSSGAAFVRFAR